MDRLRGRSTVALDDWIRDAADSGIYAMQRLANKLRLDIDAVRNAISERWSDGQTDGQINRLKVLNRAI
jgi:transposase